MVRKLRSLTDLAVFVRRFRADKRWTQKQLEHKLGIRGLQQYVSKIENGLILLPNDGFFKGLSRLSGKNEQELREMASRSEASPPSAGPQSLKLAFGHTLWAAPLVLAAYSGLFQRVAVMPSFLTATTPGDGRDASGDDISGEQLLLDAAFIEGGQVPGPSATGMCSYKSFAARGVLELLERDMADAVAIPSEVAGLRDDLLPVASIMRSVAACNLACTRELITLLHPSEAHPEETHCGRERASTTTERPPVFTMVELCRVLLSTEAAGLKGLVGIEPTTVAHSMFLRGWDRLRAERKGPLAELPEADFLALKHDSIYRISNSDLVSPGAYALLRTRCIEDRGKDLFGVITWAPTSVWLRSQSEPGNAGRMAQSASEICEVIPIQSATETYGQIPEVVFQIVIKSTLLDERPGVIPVLDELIEGLSIAADTLSSVLRDEGRASLIDTCYPIAKYFDLLPRHVAQKEATGDAATDRSVAVQRRSTVTLRDLSECLRAMGPLGFEVSVSPIYHLKLRARGSHQG